MKKVYLTLAIIIDLFLIVACNDRGSYTISGMFLNGTTNVPFRNVSVDFIEVIGAKGQQNFNFLGNTRTDSNGEFIFKYSVVENNPSSLRVIFGDNGINELLQENNIPIFQNNKMNFYLSDSCTTDFLLQTTNPLLNNEKLRIYTYGLGVDTTVNKSIITNNKIIRVRTSEYFSYVRVQRSSDDSTSLLNIIPVEIKGDPAVNKILIKY